MNENDQMANIQKALATTANLTGKVVKKLLSMLVKTYGIPVVAGALVVLMCIITVTAAFGVEPLYAKNNTNFSKYEKQAAKATPDVISDDGTEEEHVLTAGILYAVDYFTSMSHGDENVRYDAANTASKLAPRFEYRDSVVTVTTTYEKEEEDGSTRTVTKTRHHDIKLLTRADTYRGIYDYTYKTITIRDGDTTTTKDVRDNVSFQPSWDRLIALLQEVGAVDKTEHSEEQASAALMVTRAGEAFDAGEANLEWLDSEEDFWLASALGGDFSSRTWLPPPTGKFIWPVQGSVTSLFGKRVHPVHQTQTFHNGVDIAVPAGTPVMATAEGSIRCAATEKGYGKLVVIDHGGDILTFYAHNMELLVVEGEWVEQGHIIALAGSTGVSTGPHVHFEIRDNGQPIDPFTFVSGGKPLAPEELKSIFRRVSNKTGIDPLLLEAVAFAESSFDPQQVSTAGAMGLMQLMSGTIRKYEVPDPFDPYENALGGAKYLKYLLDRYQDNLELVLAAYNAGPGNVDKHNGVPPFPETTAYIPKVLEYYQNLKRYEN